MFLGVPRSSSEVSFVIMLNVAYISDHRLSSSTDPRDQRGGRTRRDSHNSEDDSSGPRGSRTRKLSSSSSGKGIRTGTTCFAARLYLCIVVTAIFSFFCICSFHPCIQYRVTQNKVAWRTLFVLYFGLFVWVILYV